MGKPIISLIRARVGHSRLQPKKNSFVYRVFYVKVPVLKDATFSTPALFSINRFNVFSIYTQDQGLQQKNGNWYAFITAELKKANIPYRKDYAVYVISHPRLFGFAFNPISYWLVVDNNQRLRAVLCEVHNTFKQSHHYLLAKKDNAPITPDDTFIADKKLYVSPFNTIEGYYEFNFIYSPDYFKSTINYFDSTKRQILTTYVAGDSVPLTTFNILSSIILYPLMTVMVVVRIHWQAIRLYFKRVRHTIDALPKKYTNAKTTVSKKVK